MSDDKQSTSTDSNSRKEHSRSKNRHHHHHHRHPQTHSPDHPHPHRHDTNPQPHHRNRHKTTKPRQGSQEPPAEVNVTVNSPTGSNEDIVIDIGSPQDRTTVHIHNNGPESTAVPNQGTPIQQNSAPVSNQAEVKRMPRSRNKNKSIHQSIGPWEPPTPDLKVIQSRNTSSFSKPRRPPKNTENEEENLEEEDEDVDTQEVGCDTLDLQRLMPGVPFFLNFAHYDQSEIYVHVGLRKKYSIPIFLSEAAFIPPTTDDYSREFFRCMKSRSNLTTLKLILELHADDDKMDYKIFNDEENDKVPIGYAGDSQCAFPCLRSNVGTFWSSKTYPCKLSFFHVELPGLGSAYLNDWKRFMEEQRNLSTMICNFGSVLWTFYSNAIKNNETTLEKIVLRRVISYDVLKRKQLPLDFGIFQNCDKLEYMKITGGGYKERWGEWLNLGQDFPQEQVVLQVNFHLLPTDTLQEFHYARFHINKKRLKEFVTQCNDKKLKMICADCPDREYYDGDWKITPSQLNTDGEEDTAILDLETEYRMLEGGQGHCDQRHREYFQRQRNQRELLIIALLIICIISIGAMIIAISFAIYYANNQNHG